MSAHAAGFAWRAAAHASTTDAHQSAGSCSAHPGRGWKVGTSARPAATMPWGAQTLTLVALVPRSIVASTIDDSARVSLPSPFVPGIVERVPDAIEWAGTAAYRMLSYHFQLQWNSPRL